MRKILTRAAFPAVLVVAVYGSSTPAAAEEIVYVPLGSVGEVLVIDAADDRIVGRVAEVPEVHGLAGTAATRTLAAGSYLEIAPDEPPVPPKPAGMSQSEHEAHHAKPPGGVTDEYGAVSFVSVIRADDGSILRRIEVPGPVHHTAVTPDGRYAVATHPNGGGVSVIDLAAFRLTTTVQTGPFPNYVVVSPNGKRIYVSNVGNNTVSEIDTGSWTVRRNFATGEDPEHIVLSHDGGTLYVNNVEDGTVSAISLKRGTVTRSFEIGGTLHGVDLSDDGRTLFVSGREENKLAAVDLESGQVRSTPLAPSPYHLTSVRGTGKLYISSAEEPKIWVIDQRSLRVLGEIPIRGVGHQMVVLKR